MLSLAGIAAEAPTAGQHVATANGHLAAKRYDEAIAAAQAAIGLDGRNLRAHSIIAEAYPGKEQWPEAEAAWRAVMALDPKNPDQPLRAGHAAWRQNKTADAEALFIQSLELATTPVQMNTLANEASLRSLWGAVKAVGVRVLDDNLGAVYGHNFLGLGYEGADRLPLAELAFRQALELSPQEAQLHTSLGRVLRKQKRYADSEAALRKAIELNSRLPDAHNELGVLFADQARHADSVEPFKQAADLAPTNAQVLLNHGEALLKAGRPAEAEPVLRKVLTITGPNETVQKLLDQAVAAKAAGGG